MDFRKTLFALAAIAVLFVSGLADQVQAGPFSRLRARVRQRWIGVACCQQQVESRCGPTGCPVRLIERPASPQPQSPVIDLGATQPVGSAKVITVRPAVEEADVPPALTPAETGAAEEKSILRPAPAEQLEPAQLEPATGKPEAVGRVGAIGSLDR